jgi:hypothetical protein
MNFKKNETRSVWLIFFVLLSALIFSVVGCETRKKHAIIHSYKLSNVAIDITTDAMDVFLYVIENGDGCYSATSNTQVTNFANVSWTKSSTIPEFKEGEAEELADIKVEISELDPAVQLDMTNDPDNFESVDGESSADGGGDSGGDSGDGGGGD